MRSKGSFLITTGLLLIVAALFLIRINLREANTAGEAAVEVVEQLVELVPPSTTVQSSTTVETETAPPPEAPLYQQYPEMEMPAVKVEGENYIGVLTIPALGLELPVMRDWSYPRLKVSPCRYAGSAYQDDLVVMAHNYDRHFGRLKELNLGDAVQFIDMDGNVFRYRVGAVESLQPTDIENMTAGEWPLTLFTCTLGGSYRVTVRCSFDEQ